MTAHSRFRLPPPAPTLPAAENTEVGSDTLARYYYQAQVAVLYALGLLDEQGEYESLYLEWREN